MLDLWPVEPRILPRLGHAPTYPWWCGSCRRHRIEGPGPDRSAPAPCPMSSWPASLVLQREGLFSPSPTSRDRAGWRVAPEAPGRPRVARCGHCSTCTCCRTSGTGQEAHSVSARLDYRAGPEHATRRHRPGPVEALTTTSTVAFALVARPEGISRPRAGHALAWAPGAGLADRPTVLLNLPAWESTSPRRRAPV